MHSVNWTTFRPPVSFFLRLAQFVSVTRLELSSCRFRFAHDLRRLTNSLPNLAELQLNRISCAFSAVMEQPSHVIQTLAKLDMRLVCLEGHPDSLLATCASYSTVTHLQVQTEWFTSLGHFRNFVEGFPVLTTLTIILGYGRTWDSAVMAGPPSLESHSSVPSLATFTLICYRSDLYHSALIEQTLAWAAGTPSVTTLRDLRIGVAEYSTIAGLTIGLVLEKVSHTLETLHIEWRIPGSTFSLMGDCLETLHLTIHVDEDTRAFERTRYTIAMHSPASPVAIYERYIYA
ncbi:uncharacterized protein B0H18DRAFT_449528 [Fomitopsis serialis]|uniref:uncharacterized protein n=1 Tax=Fomitopsis serialis TaxID=139415 RepID=UPI0020074CD8|nr:uncharacterized protein B0H18DRAFT_449528 [Neoantrodia serialis]KAH9923830.1 hypothetical protein B0H18DRAFT_449528 [Neoantrodia serialis]